MTTTRPTAHSFCAATFRRAASARDAIRRLTRAGFAPRRLAVFQPRDVRGDAAPRRLREQDTGARALRCAPVGALGGGLGATLLALLVLAFTGAGVAAVPLVAALAAGSIAGALVGAMVARAREPRVAEWAAHAVEPDQVVVAVTPRESPDQPPLRAAAELLRESGARRVVAPAA